MGWSERDLPDQAGRTVVVTGANSGLGYEIARGLAGAGGRVVLACRRVDAAEAAADEIRALSPGATLDVVQLDLADLASIRAAAERLVTEHPTIDVLVNNAGVMAIPRATTADGFEMQLGTNHLGHFALTGQVLPALLAAPQGRVLTMSSNGHRIGRIDFDDLQSERRYSRWGAYGQAKLANLLFAFELDRRFRAAGVDARSMGVHPGYARTNLSTQHARVTGSSLGERFMRTSDRLFAQSAARGALPALYAATMPDVDGGSYWGPGGPMGWWGGPAAVGSTQRSRDPDVARRLWALSEELTGVAYDELVT